MDQHTHRVQPSTPQPLPYYDVVETPDSRSRPEPHFTLRSYPVFSIDHQHPAYTTPISCLMHSILYCTILYCAVDIAVREHDGWKSILHLPPSLHRKRNKRTPTNNRTKDYVIPAIRTLIGRQRPYVARPLPFPRNNILRSYVVSHILSRRH